MEKQLKLKIVSDGSPVGTKIIDIESGNVIFNCSKLNINLDSNQKTGTCELTLINTPFEFTGNAKIKDNENNKDV
jgi:hypothetical protein